MRPFALLVALLLTLALNSSVMAGGCVKRMGWSVDVPYMMRDATGQLVGLDVDIARAALRRLDCTLELHEQPFARSLLDLEAGTLDMMPSVFRRPEREQFAHFSAPLYEARKRLYLPAAALPAFRARSLREWLVSGATLGVLPGVSYGPEFTELSREPQLRRQLHTVVNRRSLWQMLDRGRIDDMLADELTAGHELAQLGLLGKVAPAPLVLVGEPSHTIFSKRSTAADFVQRYNLALQEMARTGQLRELLKRYGAATP